MTEKGAQLPESLAIIAGSGSYPLLLAGSAREAGVRRVTAVAFPGETSRQIGRYADVVVWIRLGQLKKMLDAISGTGVRHAVMAGQITPTALFHARFDREALSLLASLPVRNARTIFAAIGDKLRQAGVELLPAHLFMDAHMATAGLLTSRAPTATEQADIELGLKVARASNELNIGQTVVIKEGTVVAVEAFEGTNETIKRAARLCGKGCVVVKTAGPGHDMRFDIPVIGTDTIRLLGKVGAGVLAVEAGRTIVLERDKVVEAADKAGISILGTTVPLEKGTA